MIDINHAHTEDTLIFVHGYAGVAESWMFQIHYFSDCYRILAPDLRGHGQSDAPYTRYDMAELVDDLNGVIETVAASDRRIVIVGHSFGGAVCAEYIHQFPEHVDAVIFIATPASFPLGLGARMAGRLPSVFYQLWWRFRPRWNAPVHVMKRMLHNNMKCWDGVNVLPHLYLPTLVITGEADTYFSPETFTRLVALLPQVTHTSIPASKHKVQLEQPALTNVAIADFLATL